MKVASLLMLAVMVIVGAAATAAPSSPVAPLEADSPSLPCAKIVETPLPVPVESVLQSVEPLHHIECEVPDRYNASPEELKLLAALAEREDYTSLESMQAVIEVVLNRLESNSRDFRHCHTVTEVILQASWIRGVYVEQYQGAANLVTAMPSPDAYEAARRACKGDRLLGNDVIFHAAKDVPAWKIANDIELAAEIGQSRFWKIKN